jgi:hypothetical protein
MFAHSAEAGLRMHDHLLTTEDLMTMPELPRQRFVAIEALCRRRLAENVSQLHHDEQWTDIVDQRVSYMSTVIAAARSLRIEAFASMDAPLRKGFDSEVFEQFLYDAQFYATQLMLEAAEDNIRASVILEGPVRQKLQTLAAHIREQIQKLNLPSGQLARLESRLAAFERELAGNRINAATIGIFCLAVSGAIADLDGTGSVVTKLVHQVQAILGKAKEEQEIEVAARLPVDPEPRRLEHPRPKAIEPKRPAKLRPPGGASEDFSRGPDFDDEIPF